ncbi:response regulator [Vibrio palustris]|uniref:Transcriptional regulatory protein BasR n=1 Tax=Vibrio palustris TaxID=1918946 RepID=A0A1R4B6M9_9VIBR|nr:response regulator [Vibrio palustris]SJL84569.1 Transcriptional regulatory protein BasR [Vibrio palustris]
MRLLLVEDDSLLGQSMVEALNRSGYTTDWVEKGQDVEIALKTEQFVSIVLDLTLPDMDGLEVLKRVRRAGHTLPILILTARDDIEDRVKGLDGGADDYLVKPFALEELLARLRVIIRRQSGYCDTNLTIGDLVLSLSEQSATYQEERLKLTNNEFKLLATLMTSAGRVLSKEQLSQSLHGWDDGANEKTIEVHIHNLRKKVPQQLIKNIRGVGYIIEKQVD